MSSIPLEQLAHRVYQWKEGQIGPISLEIYPTIRCNLNCQFCDTTDRHRPPVSELSTTEWINILTQAKHLGVLEVFVLGGGEPFVHVGIMDILQCIKDLGMYGIITTNGTLISKERSNQLIDMKWDEIHMSIDGAYAHTHDSLRGRSGSFKKTVSTLCRIRQKSTYNIQLTIHTVVNNQNYKEIPHIIELAEAIGIQRVDFDDIIAYTPEQKKLVLTSVQRKELQSIAQKASDLANQYGIATTLEQYASTEQRIRGQDAPSSVPFFTKNTNKSEFQGLEFAPCFKPFYHLTLSADGKSSPCCVLASQGGRIQEYLQKNSPPERNIHGKNIHDKNIHKNALQNLWLQDPFLQDIRQAMLHQKPLDRCKECSYNILRHENTIRTHLIPQKTP